MLLLLLIIADRQYKASFSPLLSQFCESRQKQLSLNTAHFSTLEKGTKSQMAVMQSREHYFLNPGTSCSQHAEL